MTISRGGYGRVETLHRASATRAGQHAGEMSICVWRPNQRILRKVHKNAGVPFQLLLHANGHREILPFGDMADYSRESTLVGYALLLHWWRAELGQGRDETYQLMIKMYERLLSTKAYFKRSLSSISELSIKPSGRSGDRSRTNCLPEHLGRTAGGRERKWSLRKFIEIGRERYQASPERDGAVRKFDGQAIIAHALLAAAELNPFELDPPGVNSLMRMSLIDFGSHLPADADTTLELVVPRMWSVWNDHVSDSNEKFDKYLLGRGNNLIKAVANLAGFAGGKLERGDVEWVLLKLAADSFWFIASCQNCFAQALRQNITPQFSASELDYFEQRYQPQPYFGGLTLPILWARAPILRPILRQIWGEPTNCRLHAVMWRMLEFYISITTARRESERKRRSRKEMTTSPSPTAPHVEQSNEDLEVLAVGAGMVCQHRLCPVSYQCQSDSTTLVITGVCGRHGSLEPCRLTVAEAKQILAASMDD